MKYFVMISIIINIFIANSMSYIMECYEKKIRVLDNMYNINAATQNKISLEYSIPGGAFFGELCLWQVWLVGDIFCRFQCNIPIKQISLKRTINIFSHMAAAFFSVRNEQVKKQTPGIVVSNEPYEGRNLAFTFRFWKKK